MIEQVVTITLFDKASNEEMGMLIINVYGNKDTIINKYTKGKIELENVPEVDEPDDNTPIQYNRKNPVNPGARIMLLEETEYQIRFIGNESTEEKPTFPTLFREQEKNSLIFQQWRLRMEEKLPILEGTLNFHSYVGKSFFDVKIGDLKSRKHPFEVRSKKIGYRDQYQNMINDLSKASSSLLLTRDAPLFQHYDFEERKRKTFYEDYMFLEYIFNPDHFPRAYEHIRRYMYNQLEKQIKTVPVGMANSINTSDLIKIVSNPENLFPAEEVPSNWPDEMNNFIPLKIEQEYCEETIDTPENRLLKALLEGLDQLTSCVQEEAKSGYIQDRLSVFISIVQDYLSDGWISEVGILRSIPSNSQVLQKKEGYREIFQYYLNFEFAFRIEWSEMHDLLKGYNRRLSEMYEYWCYIKLINVIEKITGHRVNIEDLFEKGKKDWTFKLRRGNRSIQKFRFDFEGKRIYMELMYNKRFSRKTKRPSYSLPFKPDYTVYLKIGERESYVHFDAKYRSEVDVLDFYKKIGGEPLKEVSDPEEQEEENNLIKQRDGEEEKLRKFKDGDIYKMHTYKDAILRSEGAYIFYPGDRQALFKLDKDAEIPSVGAFPLTPGKEGMEEEELEAFIKGVLRKILLD